MRDCKTRNGTEVNSREFIWGSLRREKQKPNYRIKKRIYRKCIRKTNFFFEKRVGSNTRCGRLIASPFVFFCFLPSALEVFLPSSVFSKCACRIRYLVNERVTCACRVCPQGASSAYRSGALHTVFTYMYI